MDLRNPSLRDAMPADVRALLAGLVGSATFARISGLRDVRREQRFAYPVGETLITGVFDVIAQDQPGHLLVLDYKSDRLAGADPETVVAERYTAQRMIYALAALKLGAPAVEVVHLFLEAAEEPVSAEFVAGEIPALEAELAARVARVGGSGAGDFRRHRRRPDAGSATAARPRAGSAPTRSSAPRANSPPANSPPLAHHSLTHYSLAHCSLAHRSLAAQGASAAHSEPDGSPGRARRHPAAWPPQVARPVG